MMLCIKYHVHVGGVPRRWTVLFPAPKTIWQKWSPTLALWWSHMLLQCKNEHPVVTKIYFDLETEQGINKYLRKQFTWFLSFTLYWGWKNVKTIGCEQQNNNCGQFSIANATELEVKHSGKVFPIIVIKFHFDTVPLVILATVTKPRGGKCLKYRSHGQNIPGMQMCAA